MHLVEAVKQSFHAFTVFDRYIISNIKNTWDSVSSGYPNIKSWKYDVLWSVFDEIRGVWIANETLSRVFDKSSQWKQKGKQKITIYANRPISIYQNSAYINRPQHEALENKLCSYSPEPRAEFY